MLRKGESRGHSARSNLCTVWVFFKCVKCSVLATIIMSTRSKSSIYLIGHTSDHFKAGVLPSNLETLAVFFHYHCDLKNTIRDSARITVQLIKPFWTELSRIPIMQDIHAIGKLEKLHLELIALKKSKNRKNQKQIENENAFREKLKMLFDIAAADALEVMTNTEDKEFLLAQRLPERLGRIVPVKDVKLAGEEKASVEQRARIKKRREQEESFKDRYFKRLSGTRKAQSTYTNISFLKGGLQKSTHSYK